MVYPPGALMADFEVTAPDGRKFIVSAPDGASQDEVLRYAQQNMPAADAAPERGAGERALRATGLAGKGFNDAIGEAVGSPFDIATWLLKQPARLMSEETRAWLPDLPAQGFYGQKAAAALNALGRNDTPETAAEKIAYGAGRGVGNAAAIMAPASLVAQGARAGSVTQNVARTMAAQPAMQAVSGAVGGAVGEVADSPALGIAASLAVPAAVAVGRGIVSPGGTRPSPETRRLVDVAKAEGIPLTPGQTTGSRPLRTTESVFATLPTTAGRQEAINDAQRVAFNKAVMARAGETQAERATPDVIEGFLGRAGRAMGDVYERNVMRVDAPTAQAVRAIAAEARRELPKDAAKPILNRVEDFISKIETPTPGASKVDGKAFGALDSQISQALRREMDGKVRHYLGRLQEELRDAFAASLSADDAALLGTARRQYANGKLIEAAMNAPNIQTAAGNIPPAGLSQALAQGAGHNFARGRGDLNDLTRVGRAFIQDAIPNSGTPERMAIQGMLTGSIYSGGNVLSPEMLMGAAGGLLGPRVAQSAYYAPWSQRYLTNQLADRALPRVPQGLLGTVAVEQGLPLLLPEH